MNPIVPTSVVIGPWQIGNVAYSISDFIENKKTQIEALNDTTGVLYLTKAKIKNQEGTMYEGNAITKPIGTVDYTTGEIIIKSYQFDIGVVKNITAVSTPNVLNIKTAKNAVLKLNNVYIDIEDLV